MYQWWALVGLAIFLIGVTKSGFGSGVGLMIVPMTAIAMSHLRPEGEKLAMGLLLPLLLLGDILAVWQYRHIFSLNIVKHLLPGSVIGVLLGGTLFFWMHHMGSEEIAAALLRIEIGIESVLLVSLAWWRMWRGVQTRLMREPLRSNITGAFAGASSTLAHAAGPIVAMYLLPLKLDRQTYVGTSAIYFFILNTAKLPTYTVAGMISRSSLWFSLIWFPLIVCGAVFGLWLNKRIKDKIFMRLVYAITFCLGWYILIDGATKLAKSLH